MPLVHRIDIPHLKALAILPQNGLALVSEPLNFYRYEAFSTVPANEPEVLRPDSIASNKPGRWVKRKIDMLGFSAENKEGSVVRMGMALSQHTSGVGFVKANASDNMKNGIGLAGAQVENLFSTGVIMDGILRRPDWTEVTGTVTLAARAEYYLDTVAGMLTVSPPTVVGQVVQKIGKAVSTDTLEICIEPAILL